MSIYFDDVDVDIQKMKLMYYICLEIMMIGVNKPEIKTRTG